MHGLALLTAMRADVQWCTIAFLMITAEAARDKVMAAIQAGCQWVYAQALHPANL
jgi:hypothetical protein